MSSNSTPKRKSAKTSPSASSPKTTPLEGAGAPRAVAETRPETRQPAKLHVSEAGSGSRAGASGHEKAAKPGSLSSERLLDPPGVALIEPRRTRPLPAPLPLADRMAARPAHASPTQAPGALSAIDSPAPAAQEASDAADEVSETSRARRANPQPRIPQRLSAPLPGRDPQLPDPDPVEPVPGADLVPLHVSKLRKLDPSPARRSDGAVLHSSPRPLPWSAKAAGPNLAERLAMNLAASEAGLDAHTAPAASPVVDAGLPAPVAESIAPQATFAAVRHEPALDAPSPRLVTALAVEEIEPAPIPVAPLARRAPERQAPARPQAPAGPGAMVTARNALVGFALAFVEQSHLHVLGPVAHVWHHKGEFLSALLHIFAPLALALMLANSNTYTQAIFMEGGWRQNLFKLVWLYLICLFMWTILYIAGARLFHSLWGDWKGWERVGRGFMSPNNRDE